MILAPCFPQYLFPEHVVASDHQFWRPTDVTRELSDFRRVHLSSKFWWIKRGNAAQEAPFTLSPYYSTGYCVGHVFILKVFLLFWFCRFLRWVAQRAVPGKEGTRAAPFFLSMWLLFIVQLLVLPGSFLVMQLLSCCVAPFLLCCSLLSWRAAPSRSAAPFLLCDSFLGMQLITCCVAHVLMCGSFLSCYVVPLCCEWLATVATAASGITSSPSLTTPAAASGTTATTLKTSRCPYLTIGSFLLIQPLGLTACNAHHGHFKSSLGHNFH